MPVPEVARGAIEKFYADNKERLLKIAGDIVRTLEADWLNEGVTPLPESKERILFAACLLASAEEASGVSFGDVEHIYTGSTFLFALAEDDFDTADLPP